MEPLKIPVDEILEYWFGACVDKPETLNEQGKLWFIANEAVDLEIKLRFGNLFEYLASFNPGRFSSARSALAGVLVLDQFSRNCFRSTPRAFEFDRQALAIMDRALEKGWDAHLSFIERAFLLMPLQHSEALHRQKQGKRMYRELVLRSTEPYTEYMKGMEKFASKHWDIIERFGRFPHRNRILNRLNTPEEEAYLNAGAPSFGQ